MHSNGVDVSTEQVDLAPSELPVHEVVDDAVSVAPASNMSTEPVDMTELLVHEVVDDAVSEPPASNVSDEHIINHATSCM